jgi:hypothetical protein
MSAFFLNSLIQLLKIKFNFTVIPLLLVAFSFEFIMLFVATVLGLIYDTDIDNGTIDSWPG